MKSTQRLDYNHLVEILRERGIVDAQVLQTIQQSAAEAGVPFPELLMMQELVTDWELSRLICEFYGLPFVPVDQYPPTPEALELIDADFVRTHRLIPIARHDQTLTVCMPALVPAEVLGLLAARTDLSILPFVGTVNSNSRWILENLPSEAPTSLPATESGPVEADLSTAAADGGWDDFFDEADAAVLMDLQPGDDDPPSLPGIDDELPGLEPTGELAVDEPDAALPQLPDLPQVPDLPPSEA